MDKAQAINVIRQTLADEIAVMKAALAESEESATGDETKSEGKYDTRAIEASYLAEAQERQLAQKEEALTRLERFEPESLSPDQEVGAGALVEMDGGDGEIEFFLLAPAGGGTVVDFLGCDLTVITPESGLYQELMGKKLGDTLEERSLTVTGVE